MIRSSPFPTARNGSLVSMLSGGATSTGTSAPTVSAAASTTSAAKPEVEGFSLEELKTMSILGHSFRSVAPFHKETKGPPNWEHSFFTSMALDAEIFWMHGPGFLNAQPLGHVA